MLGCGRLLNADNLRFIMYNPVDHESALPKVQALSPMACQIHVRTSSLPISLFEAGGVV